LDEGAGGDARLGAVALFELGQVLGLFWKAPAGEQWEPEVVALVEARESARKSKEWGKADELRAALLERGVLVEDSASGPKLKRK
jgi:cysteinyl-tRNA synthetase